jgi:hypothetical protein
MKFTLDSEHPKAEPVAYYDGIGKRLVLLLAFDRDQAKLLHSDGSTLPTHVKNLEGWGTDRYTAIFPGESVTITF